MWKLILTLFVLCFLANAAVPGYQLSNIQNNDWGIQGTLSRIPGSSGPYGGDIDTLTLYVYYQTEDILRVKIIDPANERWEVPDVIQLTSPPSKPPTSMNYKVELINSPFGIAVSRVTDDVTLWNTSSPTTGTQFNGLIVHFYFFSYFLIKY